MTDAKTVDRAIPGNVKFEICRVTAPLAPDGAWEIESLLLQVFGYGDYSFRSALSGEYSEALNCTFFLAKHKGKTIGAAGCLYAHKNPAISIIGPVGVLPRYRGNGIGTKLVSEVIDFIQKQQGKAIYLGVSDGNPAASLYKRLGFEKYQGIVMRRLLCSKQEFEGSYFGKCCDTKIRRAEWGDFPGIQALVSFPCSMYTFDFRRSIFSSKYIEPAEFLSVFPGMMKLFSRHGGFANVLVARDKEAVVGVAHVSALPGKAQQHIAELDYYVHDNFIEEAEHLVSTTIEESASLSIDRINCYCLASDNIKRNIIEALGAKQISVLHGNACINGSVIDVLVYEVKRA